jgi:hypothetical protein
MKCHIPDCPDTVYENDLCIFHCPKDDWFDIEDGEKDWSKSQDKIDLFWDSLQAKFDIADYVYGGYIFPKAKADSLFSSDKSKEFNADVTLDKTVFHDHIIFNMCNFKERVLFHRAIFLGEVTFLSGTFNWFDASNILLNGSFTLHSVTFEKQAWFTLFLSNKIKIDIIGIKILGDFEFSIYDNPVQQIFEHMSELVKYKNYKSIKNPALENFYFTGEVKDKVSCKFAFADSKIDHVLIRNHNSGLFVCEQFSIQKTLIVDHFINFGKAVFLNVNAENTKNISIRSSIFGDTFFEYVKWGNISRFKCTRDEFRQLKNVYDKQANYIEANKFYASEMEAYSNEMKAKRWNSLRIWPEYLLLGFGKYSSNHSQNWLLAFGWILAWSLMMFGLHQEAKLNFDVIMNYSQYSFDWNAFAKFANPFRLDLKCDDKAYISLLHKIVSGFLIYHFIIALRRNTKR